MKVLKKIMFLSFAICALVLSSCSNDSQDPDKSEQGSTEEFMKFKYNGTVYNFEPGISTSLNVNIMGASGIDNTYKSVSLWMPKTITAGSHAVVYDLSKLESTYQVSFSFMPDFSNASATSGTVNITAVDDKKIEGTFTFSGTKGDKTFTVTEGSFRILK